MAGVPWGTIITTLPALVAAANRYLAKTEQQASPDRKPPADPRSALEDAIRRIEVLESLEPEQTRLLQETMQQLQNVAVLASATARKVNIALGLSAVAVVLALVAVFR